jgi:ABC-type dipeptide/oligopeptide/nickel transport system ATPase component
VSTPSLRTERLTIRFGGHAAVNGVTCAFRPGELTAIVGPNGAGKTTWFNLVSGQLAPTEGRIFLGERDITGLSPSARALAGVGRAFQLTNLFPAPVGSGERPPRRPGPAPRRRAAPVQGRRRPRHDRRGDALRRAHAAGCGG